MAIYRQPFFAMQKNVHALPPRVHVVNRHGLVEGMAPRGYMYTRAEGLHISAFYLTQ